MGGWIAPAPPHSETPGGSFAKGFAISILLWVLLALAVVSLAGCETYQPPAGGLEGGVREVLG